MIVLPHRWAGNNQVLKPMLPCFAQTREYRDQM